MEQKKKKSAEYLEGFFDGTHTALEFAGKCADDADKLNFEKGYAQAQKALTWEDIKEIDEWISVVQTSDNLVGEELYKEVLLKFIESKI